MAVKRARTHTTRASRTARSARKRVYHPGPPISDEAVLREAAERLRAKDPEVVERLIGIGGPPPLRRREAGFAGLAAIIMAHSACSGRCR